MKKKILFIIIASLLTIMNFVSISFATDTSPLDGPGINMEAAQNDGIVGYKQYDLNEKYINILDNGCIVECPFNILTDDGMVTTKNHRILSYDDAKYLSFDYTGLRNKITNIYIKSINQAGVMIDLKKVQAGYETDYNFKTGKFKNKPSTSTYNYKIPTAASKVEVLGIVDSY